MNVEIELKFTLAPRSAGRVMRHPAIERAAVGPPVSGKVLSIYYDTPNFDLRTAGIALRLRRTDTGWVQTVKWGGNALGGLHQRNELEMAVAGQKIELDALRSRETAPDTSLNSLNSLKTAPQPSPEIAGDSAPEIAPDIASAFASARLRKRLRPVFVTDVERTSRMLAWPSDGSAELSMDRGRVIAGHVQETICELELELKSGETEGMFALVAALASDLDLRPAARSKAERGYTLAGVEVLPVRARPVQLERSLSIPESAARIIASGLEQVQANEYGMLHSEDPEYLHQMRVAVRRLRSCLTAYAHALASESIDGLRAELRWLGRRLGPARDWDVFLTEMLPPLEAGLRDVEDMGTLREGAQQLRDAACRSARTAVRSRRYAHLVFALGRIVATRAWHAGEGIAKDPVLPFATRLLDQRFKHVLGRGGGRKARSVEELHALRIAVKKLRYLVEYFSGLYPGARLNSFRESLMRLQDCLGVINDASAMHGFVERALPSSTRLGPIAVGWSARTVQDERERLRMLWREFRRRRKFW